MLSNHLKNHMAVIPRHEEELLGSWAARELEAFAGGLGFAALHVAWFTTWIFTTSLHLGNLRGFSFAR